MEKSTVHQIVSDRNKEFERHAVRTAEGLISEIADQQERIKKSEERIAELRKELKELTIAKIEAKDILGEE